MDAKYLIENEFADEPGVVNMKPALVRRRIKRLLPTRKVEARNSENEYNQDGVEVKIEYLRVKNKTKTSKKRGSSFVGREAKRVRAGWEQHRAKALMTSVLKKSGFKHFGIKITWDWVGSDVITYVTALIDPDSVR